MSLEIIFWLRFLFLGGLLLVVLILILLNVFGEKNKN